MITKETIAQYCVQFALFITGWHYVQNEDFEEGFAWQNAAKGFVPMDGVPLQALSSDELFEEFAKNYPLPKMVDEMLGDEYAIVREFLEWNWIKGDYNIDLALDRFKAHRTIHQVTLDELKAVYAQSKGIKVEKIEVREEGK